MKQHEEYMKLAIEEAKKAGEIDEVPIGAIAVLEDKVVGRAHNIREKTGNPLGHAELLLLQELTKKSEDWRFEDVTIYVTCEPCIMCTGAMLQARVSRVVFGCLDPKAGACGSLYNLADDNRLNHQIEIIGGILAEECGQLLKNFFKRLRDAPSLDETVD